MRVSKLFVLFILLTTIHLCAHLHPKINANIELQSKFPDVEKIVKWNVGYDFDLNMLWQALLNSAFAAVGIYLWQGRTNEPNATDNVDDERHTMMKRIWPLEKINRLLTSKCYWLLAAPWALTLAASWIMNYIKLVLVIKNFSDSLLHMLILYVRMQFLFLIDAVTSSTNYAGQLTGFTQKTPMREQSYLSVVTDLLH